MSQTRRLWSITGRVALLEPVVYTWLGMEPDRDYTRGGGVNKQRVLFLCTHNSARSQMAEGFLRAMGSDQFEVASASTEATRVHPLAIKAMAEVGVDISRHAAKTLDQFLGRLHWSFEDPSQADGTQAARLEAFRRVRDEIRGRLVDWIRVG
jgi:arsenate reductase (thioredoxin)